MSFIKTLQAIRKGALVALLADDLKEVSEAVAELGKTGSLTLQLTIKPNGDAVIVQPKITKKVPQQAVGDAIFFVGEKGLQREDPKQTDIEDELAARRIANQKGDE